MLELFVYFCQLVAVLAVLVVAPALLGLVWAMRAEKKKEQRLNQFWREKR